MCKQTKWILRTKKETRRRRILRIYFIFFLNFSINLKTLEKPVCEFLKFTFHKKVLQIKV
jgi:hypothetical protein